MVYTCEKTSYRNTRKKGVTFLGILLSWKCTDFERKVREQLYKEQGKIT